jgi:hypothetical protein
MGLTNDIRDLKIKKSAHQHITHPVEVDEMYGSGCLGYDPTLWVPE